MSITPSNATQILSEHVLDLFRRKYQGGSVRNIGVRYDKLVNDTATSYTLFDDVQKIEKMESLDKTIDEIRDKFGFLSIQKASSFMEGSRARERSKLIGGHCGGLEGIK